MPRRVTKNVDEFIGRIRDNRTNRIEDLTTWKISTFQWRRVAMALAKNKSMEVFQLEGDESQFHRMRPSVARYIGNMLAVNSHLMAVNVARKAIGDEGCQHFARALLTNHTLVSLDLASNVIGDAGIKALSQALEVNSGLTELNLRGNTMSADASLSLARAIKHNSSLTHLDLASTGIETDSVMWLAKGMLMNRTLTFLDLAENEIGVTGALALADVSIRNECWAYLRLHGRLPLLLLQGVQSQVAEPVDLEDLIPPEPDPDAVEGDGAGEGEGDGAAAAVAAGRDASPPTNGEGDVGAGAGSLPPGSDGGDGDPDGDDRDDAEANDTIGDLPTRPLLSPAHSTGSALNSARSGTGSVLSARSGANSARSGANSARSGAHSARSGDAAPADEETGAGEGDNSVTGAGDGPASVDADTMASPDVTSPAASQGVSAPSARSGTVRSASVLSRQQSGVSGVSSGVSPLPQAAMSLAASYDARGTLVSDGGAYSRMTDLMAAGSSVFGGIAASATPMRVINEEEYQWLDLADMTLGTEDLIVVGRLLWYNSTATALDLSLNLLAGPKGKDMAGVLALCEAIKHNTTLTLLDLQETGMADSCAVALAEAAHHSDTLRLIRFDESELPVQVLRGAEPQDILELRTPDHEAIQKERGGKARAMSVYSDLEDTHRTAQSGHSSHPHESASVAGSAFGMDESVFDDDDMMSQLTGEVTEHTAASTSRSRDGRVRMRNARSVASTPLLPLTIRESRFVGEVMRLRHNTSITTLDGITIANRDRTRFYNDDVMYHQVVMMGIQLRTITTLKTLDLSSQEIGVLGALVLSTNLAYNMALQRLIIHHADLRTAGAQYVCSALRRQRIKTITELDLSWNDIRDEGAMAVARLLADLPQLKSVKRVRKQLLREKRAREDAEVAEMVSKSKHLRKWMKVDEDHTRPEDLIGEDGEVKGDAEGKGEGKGQEAGGGSGSDGSDGSGSDDDYDSSSSSSSSSVSSSDDGGEEEKKQGASAPAGAAGAADTAAGNGNGGADDEVEVVEVGADGTPSNGAGGAGADDDGAKDDAANDEADATGSAAGGEAGTAADAGEADGGGDASAPDGDTSGEAVPGDGGDGVAHTGEQDGPDGSPDTSAADGGDSDGGSGAGEAEAVVTGADGDDGAAGAPPSRRSSGNPQDTEEADANERRSSHPGSEAQPTDAEPGMGKAKLSMKDVVNTARTARAGSERPGVKPEAAAAESKGEGAGKKEEEAKELTPEEAKAERERLAQLEADATVATGESKTLRDKLQAAVQSINAKKRAEEEEYQRLPELEVYDLTSAGKGPDKDFATHLPEGVAALRSLHVRGNKIEEVGLVGIAMGLGACSTLTSLSLSWNSFTEVATKALADGMLAQGRLVKLELDCCNISPNGAVHLAYAVSQQRHLTELSISSDPLSHPFTVMTGLGVTAFAAALYHDTCAIKHLRLKDCQPSRAGTRALAQVLMHSTRLETLDLSCTLKTVYLPKEEVEVQERRYEELAERYRRRRRQDQIVGTGEVSRKITSKSKARRNAGVNLNLVAEECHVPFLDIDERVWEKLVHPQARKTTAHVRQSRARALSVYSDAITARSAATARKSGGLTARSGGGALTARSGGGALTARSGISFRSSRTQRTALSAVSRADTMAAVAAAVEYDLALDSAEFRVTREEEDMYGIADKLGLAQGGDYGMSEDPNHGLVFTKTGKQVQPDELGPRHKGDRRGSLSKNLERVFGKTAVNALKGVEETKKNTGFDYGAFDGNMEDFHDDGAVAVPMALGRDNAFLLARGLAANTTLKVLALRGNQIGNDGANAFGRVLDNNLKLQSQLTVLDVSKNQVSAATAFSMVSKMKHSETFKHFDVRDNDYDERTKRDLREAAGKYMAVHV